METFCGSDLSYWNLTLTWHSMEPDFPICFQETGLAWMPCLFLLLTLPYHLIRALRRKRTSWWRRPVAGKRDFRNTSFTSTISADRVKTISRLDSQTSADSGSKTPRNSISSIISNASKRILRKALEQESASYRSEKQRRHRHNRCCVDSFPARQFRSSKITGVKQCATLLLLFVCFVELLYGLFTDFADATRALDAIPQNDPIFEAVTPGIRLFIFILVLAIQYLHWRHRIVSSISLFLFWLLSTVQAAIVTRSLILNYWNLTSSSSPSSRYKHYDDRSYVTLKLFGNLLIFIEFFLALIAEPIRPPDDDGNGEDDFDYSVSENSTKNFHNNDDDFGYHRNDRKSETVNGAKAVNDDDDDKIKRDGSIRSRKSDSGDCPECPLPMASVASRLTFWWVTPLVWQTFRNPPLTFARIWRLSNENWSIINAAKFSRHFVIRRWCDGDSGSKFKNKSKSDLVVPEVSSARYESTNLIFSLVRTFAAPIAFNAFLKLCCSFLPYLSPLFLDWLIRFIEQRNASAAADDRDDEREPSWHGAIYVALMVITPMIDTMIHVQYNFGINVVLLRIKASLCNAIYRKGLRLSSAGREQFTTGEIINLMAIDTARIGDFFLQLNESFSVPLQIAFAIYLLWQQLGIASLAGLVILALLLPLNSCIVARLSALSQYVMEYKDKRLKLMHDLLSGIKVVKLYAWEDAFRAQIAEKREHELRKLRTSLLYQACVVFIFFSVPFFATIASFGTFVLLDPAQNRLDAAKAFVSLALFNQLRTPFAQLPRLFAFYSMFIISLRRLNRFMRGDELYHPNDGTMIRLRPDSNTIYDVKIDAGRFVWANFGAKASGTSSHRNRESTTSNTDCVKSKKSENETNNSETIETTDCENSTKPVAMNKSFASSSMLLDNIDLHVRKGSLVAIVGQVGAGKSSLLAAMLGDMPKISGTLKINRSIAYVSQQAWIQNASVRANILFDCHANDHDEIDDVRYRKIIEACALTPDLEILPAGDRTEIGEKGVNLSGGQRQRVSIARAAYADASLYLFDDPLSALDAGVAQRLFDSVIGPRGLLRTKTRILVTHRLSILPRCDRIAVMRDGRITFYGTYAQLRASTNDFAETLRGYCDDSASVSGSTSANQALDEISSPPHQYQQERNISIHSIEASSIDSLNLSTLLNTEPIESYHYDANIDDRPLGEPIGSLQPLSTAHSGQLEENELDYIDMCFKDIFDQHSLNDSDPHHCVNDICNDTMTSIVWKPKTNRVVSFVDNRSRNTRSSSSTNDYQFTSSSPAIDYGYDDDDDNSPSFSLSPAIASEADYDDNMRKSSLTASSTTSNKLHSSTKEIFRDINADTHTGAVRSEAMYDANRRITIVEKSETGSIKLSCYWNYFRLVGLSAVACTLLLQCFKLACNIGASQWLSRWSRQTTTTTTIIDTNITTNAQTDVPPITALFRPFQSIIDQLDLANDNVYYLAIYIVLGLSECIFTLFTTIVINISTLRASRRLHADMLDQLLRSPMSFFESNPIGRILNRFSKDIDVCDATLNMNFRMALFQASRAIVAILVIAIDAPPVLLAVIPLAVVYFAIQIAYLPAARQLRRIESMARSPIYSHFGETLNGAATIRAFGRETEFVHESNRRIDRNHTTIFAIAAASQWIVARLEFLGYMVVMSNAIYCLLMAEQISASTAGLTLTYSMTITRSLTYFIMVTSQLENSVVSFERCVEYTKLENEAAYDKPENENENDKSDTTGAHHRSTSSLSSWPERGEIEFRNYATRYRAGLDPVLRNISFKIAPGERVGVVGRTGAGKSSITLALFRIIERIDGQILIDGRDIADLGLRTLRSRLTIIPQDPMLFTGTLRLNLDPFGTRSDDEIWQSLELTNMRPFVSTLELGLSHPIAEGGDNLSVGQRQLLCLARALLRRSTILILDEATAAVDVETDAIIQRTIRTQFANSGTTILTIAHRLETIIDYDRILVLHEGAVHEFDTPERLLSDPNSAFSHMARQAGLIV